MTLHRYAPAALRILAIAVAYYVAARLGLLLALVRGQVTPLWPPTGIAMFALLVWGVRVWPGITLGALLVNLPIGPSVPDVLLIAAGNTAAPVVAYVLLTRTGFRMELDHLRDALAMVFFGAFGGALISATVGSLALVRAGAVPADRYWATWSVWWTGDAMGLLVVTPLLLVARTVRWPLFDSWRRWVEAIALLVSTTTAVVVVALSHLPMLFLVFPLLIWAAVRFQQLGATPCAFIVSTVTTFAVAHGSQFAALGPVQQMVALQAFNGSVVLTALLLSVLVAERNIAHRAIQRAVGQLSDALARQGTDRTLLRGSLLSQGVVEDARSYDRPPAVPRRETDPPQHGGPPLLE